MNASKNPGFDEFLLSHERKLWNKGIQRVAGIDEAGRGPLAGPLVVAAAAFPPYLQDFPPVNDSKQLRPKEREYLYHQLQKISGFIFAIIVVSAEEIDRINIFEAVKKGMIEAATRVNAEYVLVDGIPFDGFQMPAEFIVKGDAKSASIAAASILAKVHRDEIMRKYSLEYPNYGFDKHMGYGTKKHIEALLKHGPCEIHRKTFAPVRNILSPPPQQLRLDI